MVIQVLKAEQALAGNKHQAETGEHSQKRAELNPELKRKMFTINQILRKLLEKFYHIFRKTCEIDFRIGMFHDLNRKGLK